MCACISVCISWHSVPAVTYAVILPVYVIPPTPLRDTIPVTRQPVGSRLHLKDPKSADFGCPGFSYVTDVIDVMHAVMYT